LDNDEPFGTPAVINDRGQVLVESESATSGWLWQNGRRPARIGLEPIELNGRGDVVGYRDTGRRDDCYHDPIRHAVLWQNGRMRDLGTLATFKDKRSITVNVAAINDHDQIVGRDIDPCGDDHAFLWENGRMRGLGTFGGAGSHADAINDRGQIVGSAQDRHGRWRAFLWQNGRMLDLGSWWPIAINDRGQIVGTTHPSVGRVHAVLWQDGGLRDLGVLPGDRRSGPIGINDRGQIIGVSYKVLGDLNDEFGPDESDSGMRPFVWESGRMTALPGPRPGATGVAVAVNNTGQIIGWNRAGSVLWTR
jgi:probable HAF family extracellular repeat protein